MTIVIGLGSLDHIKAQRNCGTVEYQELLKQRNPAGENIPQFEEWLKNQIDNKSKTDPFQILLVKEPIIQIPVVVHVVHNGEPYGIGSNITDEQILSQIQVLNEDFRRLNADADETFPIFESVAADTEIEFVMAKQDPEGLPTDGILRVQGTQTSWGFSTDTELKSLSYWPAEDYLNMWVTTLGGGLLG
ncbi:MAG: Pregnancy-associated plasma protein-A, partial [Saprospiraceae bacterium]|nr:Pregnancy-associated plasma protein-A [Saprospiraceae bacterium]